MKAFGVIRGIPDLLLFFGTVEQPKFGAIELKSAKGKLSEYQVGFKEQWERRGGLYAICRTVAEVEDAVVSWGLKPSFRGPKYLSNNTTKQMRMMAYNQIMMEIGRERKDD